MQPGIILGKTPRGRDELGKHGSALTRPQRNLVVVADGKRTAAEMLAMMGIADEGVLDALVADGILEIVGEAPKAAPKPAIETVHVPELDQPLPSLLKDTPFERVYTFLSQQIPNFLGIGAFTLTLKLEKAATLAELEPIQRKLLEAVEKKRGRQAATAFRERMLLLARD